MSGWQRSANVLAALGMVSTNVWLGTVASQPSAVVRTAVQFDISLPLSEMRPNVLDGLLLYQQRGLPGASAASSLVTVSGGPLVTFEGMNRLNSGNSNTPDPNGDFGSGYYLQTVNRALAVWDASGNALLAPIPLTTLFGGFGSLCETGTAVDPIALYDHLANRWVVTYIHLGQPYHQCVAVSQTANPLGSWYRYAFLWGDSFNDYAKLGIWPNGYYVSAEQDEAEQGIAALERERMIVGDPNARLIRLDLNTYPGLQTFLLPSDLDGQLPPTNAPNYLARVQLPTLQNPGRLEVYAFTVNWSADPPSSSFTQVADLTPLTFDANLCTSNPLCIDQYDDPQPGTPPRLDAIPELLMHRLQYRNFGTYQTLVTNHTVDVNGAGRAGIRWYELRNSGSGWAIHDQGTYSPNSDHRWMGSVALNADGVLALGYTVSSTATYPSIRYTGRVPGAPLGLLNAAEQTLRDGTGSYLSERWGDYSAMAVSADDDKTFWFTHEHVPVTGTVWHTQIGALHPTPETVTIVAESFGDRRYYEAQTSVSATNVTVAAGADVTFRTVDGGSLILHSGFHVETGASFSARTDMVVGGSEDFGAHAASLHSSDTGSPTASNTASEGFTLQPPRPNPFRNVAEVQFSLSNAGVARLTLHDLLGREVGRFLDGPLQAGVHRLRFYGTGLSAGVYLLRLSVGSHVTTTRLTRVE